MRSFSSLHCVLCVFTSARSTCSAAGIFPCYPYQCWCFLSTAGCVHGYRRRSNPELRVEHSSAELHTPQPSPRIEGIAFGSAFPSLHCSNNTVLLGPTTEKFLLESSSASMNSNDWFNQLCRKHAVPNGVAARVILFAQGSDWIAQSVPVLRLAHCSALSSTIQLRNTTECSAHARQVQAGNKCMFHSVTWLYSSQFALRGF